VVEMMTRAIEIAKSVMISRKMLRLMTMMIDDNYDNYYYYYDDDDNDSLSGSIESTGDDNVEINHVAPPMSSSLLNVAPVGTWRTCRSMNSKKRQENVYNNS
jgi:hypothetical protein